MFSPNYFPKFFTLHAVSYDNLVELAFIRANKELINKMGDTPHRVTEKLDGCLLVEVKSEEQSNKTCNLSHVSNSDNSYGACKARTIKGTMFY